MSHYPVLLDEVVQYVGAATPGIYVDATAGGGGHTRAIALANLKNQVVSVDWDNESLTQLGQQLAKEKLGKRIKLIHSNYADAMRLIREQGLEPVQGIVLDLGFSSLQLDEPERGFSFQNPGPLDMRYDRSQKLTAAVILNKYQEQELSDLFKKYGEEPHAKKIARALVVRRKSADFHSADQVYSVIKQALPAPVRHKAADAARRIFQALRIEVNSELDNLSRALPQMFESLATGGRLVVISFHSLEDRIVKNFFADLAKGCICPPEFPECICGNKPKVEILTKKPVTAQPQELAENPRSKPAKLRAIQKIN